MFPVFFALSLLFAIKALSIFFQEIATSVTYQFYSGSDRTKKYVANDVGDVWKNCNAYLKNTLHYLYFTAWDWWCQ